MNLSDVKFDCRHFRIGIPCLPNKKENAICPSCNAYDKIQTRILIIKLGALGDVIRTTPLLERFKKEYAGVHVTWLTLSPAILPKEQIEVDNKKIRTFSPNVEEEELKWHQDLSDRNVTIIEDGGWSFQMENELPVKVSRASHIHIPKFVWHRVIKGPDQLVVEIEEL